MSSFLAIRDKHGFYQYHKVPREVYVYVKQLENKVDLKKIKEWATKIVENETLGYITEGEHERLENFAYRLIKKFATIEEIQ